MAQKLGVFSQWMFGEWADRDAINRNAEELDYVEGTLSSLHAIVQRQGQEILRMRAMIMGVVEVLHAKAPFDDAELERAVQAAWRQLTAPPAPAPPMTDPYRGTPVAATAPPPRLVLCTRCGQQVPASKTNITEQGEVCDACS
jgi:hypothetical protein